MDEAELLQLAEDLQKAKQRNLRIVAAVIGITILAIAVAIWYNQQSQINYLQNAQVEITQQKNELKTKYLSLIDPEHTSRSWLNLAQLLVQKNYQTTTVASRTYAYTAGIYADVFAKTNSTAEASSATGALLLVLFPTETTTLQEFTYVLAENAQISLNTQTITSEYISRLSNDGFSAKWNGDLPTGDLRWTKNGIDPETPRAGDWKRWIIAGGTDYQAGVPAGSFSINSELNKLTVVMHEATTAQQATINYWYSYGDVSGRWLEHANKFASDTQISELDYALFQKNFSQALSDTLMESWKTKYSYWTPRPNQLITDLHTRVPTPNSPGFISENAALAGLANKLLSEYFPESRTTIAADSKAASQFGQYAGIELNSDIVAGWKVGEAIGTEILTKVKVTALATNSASENNSPAVPYNENSRQQVMQGKLTAKVITNSQSLYLNTAKFGSAELQIVSNQELKTIGSWELAAVSNKFPFTTATKVGNRFINLSSLMASNTEQPSRQTLQIFDSTKQELTEIEADEITTGATLLISSLQVKSENSVGLYYLPSGATDNNNHLLNRNYLIYREINLDTLEFKDTKIDLPKQAFKQGFTDFSLSANSSADLVIFGHKSDRFIRTELEVKSDNILQLKTQTEQILSERPNQIEATKSTIEIKYTNPDKTQARKADILNNNKLIATVNVNRHEELRVIKTDDSVVVLEISSALLPIGTNLIAINLTNGKTETAIENTAQEFKTAGEVNFSVANKQFQLITK